MTAVEERLVDLMIENAKLTVQLQMLEIMLSNIKGALNGNAKTTN